jgi:hypothetical protein
MTRKRKQAIHPDFANLPKQQAPAPVGSIGRLTPTRHEASILRRAARGFVMVTIRESKVLYTFEDGTVISDENRNPLSRKGFARLSRFLVAECAFRSNVITDSGGR